MKGRLGWMGSRMLRMWLVEVLGTITMQCEMRLRYRLDMKTRRKGSARCVLQQTHWIGWDWIGLNWIGLDWIGLQYPSL